MGLVLVKEYENVEKLKLKLAEDVEKHKAKMITVDELVKSEGMYLQAREDLKSKYLG